MLLRCKGDCLNGMVASLLELLDVSGRDALLLQLHYGCWPFEFIHLRVFLLLLDNFLLCCCLLLLSLHDYLNFKHKLVE